MDQLDVTWGRALKMWWSFTWRASVLTLIIVVPLQIFMFTYFFRHMPAAGTNPDPGTMLKMASGMMLAWPIVMAAMVALQAQGMRWMLRHAHWSDFRVALLPRDR